MTVRAFFRPQTGGLRLIAADGEAFDIAAADVGPCIDDMIGAMTDAGHAEMLAQGRCATAPVPGDPGPLVTHDDAAAAA